MRAERSMFDAHQICRPQQREPGRGEGADSIPRTEGAYEVNGGQRLTEPQADMPKPEIMKPFRQQAGKGLKDKCGQRNAVGHEYRQTFRWREPLREEKREAPLVGGEQQPSADMLWRITLIERATCAEHEGDGIKVRDQGECEQCRQPVGCWWS